MSAMSYLDNQNIYYVYQLRLENSEDPFYIGKGKGRRAKNHLLNCMLTGTTRKVHTIKKAQSLGIKINIEILHDNLEEQTSLDLECNYIAMYGRLDNGTGILTNLTNGGDGVAGYNPTDEARLKIGALVSQWWLKLTDEEIRIIQEKRISSRKDNIENIGTNISNGLNARSDKDKIKTSKLISEKMKLVHSERSDEEKNAIKNKFKETLDKKTPEEKAKRSMNHANSKSKDVIDAATKKRIATMKSKTIEERRSIIEKIITTKKLKNVPPWEHIKCTQDAKEFVWANADKLYELFCKGNAAKSLGKIYGVNYSKFVGIVNHFRKGWVPQQDSRWLKEFREIA